MLNYTSRRVELAQASVMCRNRQFVLWNDFNQRYDFAYVKKSFRSAFEQQWRETCDHGPSIDRSSTKAAVKIVTPTPALPATGAAAATVFDDDDKESDEVPGEPKQKDR